AALSQVLKEPFRAGDLFRAGKPWFVVRRLLALELHGAEHAGHGVAIDAEPRIVGKAVQLGIDVERLDGLEQRGDGQRRAREECAHLVLDDAPGGRFTERRRQCHERKLVDRSESVLLPPRLFLEVQRYALKAAAALEVLADDRAAREREAFAARGRL